MKSAICAACHQEVRFGRRGGRLAWWHRDDQPVEEVIDQRVGHEPVLGHASFDTDWDAVDAERRRYQVDTNEQEDNRVFDIPPVDVWATEIFVSKAEPDPRMPGGAKDLINAVHKVGGQTRATYSRAPRVHSAHGNLLGMSDYVMVKFRVEESEPSPRSGVAVWEDGGLDVAYRTDYDPKTKTVHPTRINSKQLRAWLCRAEWSD